MLDTEDVSLGPRGLHYWLN